MQNHPTKMDIQLHHCDHSRSMRVQWLLEEMGLPYELITHQYNPANFATPEFRKINPMGKIPALVDNGQPMVESIAIMAYLLGRYGIDSTLNVSAQDPEYGAFFQWLHLAEAGMANYASVYIGHRILQGHRYQVTEPFLGYCEEQIDKGLSYLTQTLSDRDHLLTRGFTAADIAIGWTLYMLNTMCNRPLPEGRLQEYLARLQARPAWQKIAPPWTGPTKN